AFSGIHSSKRNINSKYSVVETVRALDEFKKDYFIVFAHVHQSKGLWYELKPGRIKNLLEDTSMNNKVFAFQKVRYDEERKKVQNQLQDLYPAEVEGTDPKNLNDIVSKKNDLKYFKLGELSFSALKFALQNKNLRIQSDRLVYNHSYIKSVEFEGAGVLNGTKINLSPELNTIIGIRGSGKSSVLEGIRYALNIPFSSKATDTQYKKDLIEFNLGSGGKITLSAIDSHGNPYEIKRILHEKPDVYFNGEIVPGVSISETILNQPLYFGQKDLSNTDDKFESDLVEKLVGPRIVPYQKKIQDGRHTVIENVDRLKKLSQSISDKEKWNDKMLDAKHKLEYYKKYGIENELQKQISFDKDELKIQQIIKTVKMFLGHLENLIIQFDSEISEFASYKSTYNKTFFESFFSIYQEIIDGFESFKVQYQKRKNLNDRLKNKELEFQTLRHSLKEEFAKKERHLIRELKLDRSESINLNEYKKLKSLLDRATIMLDYSKKARLEYLKQHRVLIETLVQLDDSWFEEYNYIKSLLKNINDIDSPLKFVSKFKGDKPEMLNYLVAIYQGSGIHKSSLKKIVANYDDFGKVWQSKSDIQKLIGASFENFWSIFESNLHSLLTWQIPNTYNIMYNGKELAKHSLGQRASALLLYIINQKNNDVIIIDQPEDDIDNQTIYENVIQVIQKLKSNTQFILVTHNANFPVLGDSEQIITCEYSNNQIKTTSGGVDSIETQKNIINIMEGGKEAFNKRNQIYNSWN
ncbi:MAG: hypothetical protein OXE77_05110, partial [Flavobacteriaceae bacterium]|nr:hypothetical protein [Flavobacteriaceae bacterium]